MASSGAAVTPPPGDDALMPIHSMTSKAPPSIPMRMLARECFRADMRKYFMTPLGIGIAAWYLDSSGSPDCLGAAGPLLESMTQKAGKVTDFFCTPSFPAPPTDAMQAPIVMALRRYGILRSLQK